MASNSNFLNSSSHSVMPSAVGVTPTPMRRIEHNDRINDVINRRVRYAPPQLLKQTFGFVKFGTRVWTADTFEFVALGTTNFLRQCDLNFDKYKNPTPGCIDKVRFATVGVALDNSRMSSATRTTFDGVQAVMFGPDCSITFNNVTMKRSPLGYEMFLDALFVISFGNDLNSENSHKELEVMLARCMRVK